MKFLLLTAALACLVVDGTPSAGPRLGRERKLNDYGVEDAGNLMKYSVKDPYSGKKGSKTSEGKGDRETYPPTSTPTSSPTAVPTDEGSRRFQVCAPDECGRDTTDESCSIEDIDQYVSSDVTVGEVQDALESVEMSISGVLSNLDTDLFHEKSKSLALLIIQESNLLDFSSKALSKNFPAETEPATTQSLILEHAKQTLALIGNLSVQREEKFINIDSFFPDEEYQHVRNQLQAIRTAYENFLNSRIESEANLREKYSEEFRNTCNTNSIIPLDMLKIIYGYGCGSKGTGRACFDDDYGLCSFGPNRRLRTTLFSTNELLYFRVWILTSLTELLYFRSVCLSAASDTCINYEHDAAAGVLTQMKSAFLEVHANMCQAKECATIAVAEPLELSNSTFRALQTPPREDKIPLCVVNDRNLALPKSSPEFSNGRVIYSDITFQDLVKPDSSLSRTLSLTTDVISVLSGAATLASAAVAPFTTALAQFGSILKIASTLAGYKETDATTARLINGFRQVNARFDRLERVIQEGFDVIRKDLGNVVLDDLVNQLGRMKSSYTDFIESQALDDSAINQTLKDRYTQHFRNACNNGIYRPEDIITILYGHACGDNFKDRDCNAENGGDVGTCEHGRKQRQYLLDIFKKSTTGTAFEAFTQWYLGSFAEAFYMLAVCLPPDPAVCLSENDPILKKKLDVAALAYLEVFNNTLSVVERCTCACKQITFKTMKFPPIISIQAQARLRAFFEISNGTQKLQYPAGIDYRYRQGQREETRKYVTLDKGGDRIVNFPAELKLSQMTEQNDIQFIADIFDPNFITTKKTFFADPETTDASGSWFRNTCDTYPLTFKTSSPKAWEFTMVVSPDQCPENFCSRDKSCDDPKRQYCDFSVLRCKDKLAGEATCTDDVQCRYGECRISDGETTGACERFVAEFGVCGSDTDCLDGFGCHFLGEGEGTPRCCFEPCTSCTSDEECNCGTCRNFEIPDGGSVRKCGYACSNRDLCGPECNQDPTCLFGGTNCELEAP